MTSAIECKKAVLLPQTAVVTLLSTFISVPFRNGHVISAYLLGKTTSVLLVDVGRLELLIVKDVMS